MLNPASVEIAPVRKFRTTTLNLNKNMENNLKRLKEMIEKHNRFVNDSKKCKGRGDLEVPAFFKNIGTGIFQVYKNVRVSSLTSFSGYEYEWVEIPMFFETQEKAQEMVEKYLELDPYNEGLNRNDFKITSSSYLLD